MREHIADQRYDRAQCCLPADAIRSPVHLDEKGNRYHRADSPTNRRENDVLEAERRENIATRHHKQAGDPRTCELFGGSPAETAWPQLIQREPIQVHRCHLSTPRSTMDQSSDQDLQIRYLNAKCKQESCRARINSE
jgi:hypothetical protein